MRFTADGSAFYSVIGKFGAKDVGHWVTAGTAKGARKPGAVYPGFRPRTTGAPTAAGLVGDAATAGGGLVAFASKAGEVTLRRSPTATIALAQLPGTGATQLAFAPGGTRLVGLRAGKAYAWTLPASR